MPPFTCKQLPFLVFRGRANAQILFGSKEGRAGSEVRCG